MSKKLPRRAKSMANRAVKTAEAAADLDLLGGDEAANAPPVSVGTQAGAFTLVIVALIAVIMIVRLVVSIPTGGGNGDAPFGIDGALTRVTPTAEPVLRLGSNNGLEGTSTLLSVPRSPFPSAQQDTPIILAVACPVGSVQIATGGMVADTVCIRGELVTADGASAPPLSYVEGSTPTLTVSPTPTPTPTPAIVTALPDAGTGEGEGTEQGQGVAHP